MMKLFKKKIKDGEHLQYHPGNKIISEKMNYKNGKLEGTKNYWYESGKKSFESTYKNGKKDGPFFRYFEIGEIDRQGTYKNGTWDGPWIKYYENGNKEQVVIWDNGKVVEILDYPEDWVED